MKKIKYKVSDGEAIGLIPYGAMIDCYLVYESCEGDNALIYMPKNVRYVDEEGEEIIDKGCGALSFAMKSVKMDVKHGEFYVRSEDDYINLKSKDAKVFEKQIRELK